MDDLLIVRASDRVRTRPSQRRGQAPLGANVGLAMGVAFAAIGAAKFEQSPAIGIGIGLAVGLAIGGVAGHLLKPRSPRRTVYPNKHYRGIPPTEETEETPSKS